MLRTTISIIKNNRMNINRTSIGESIIPLLVSVLSVGESLHAEERLSLDLSGCGVTLGIPVAHLSSRVVVRVLGARGQRLQRQAFGHIGQRLKCIQERETDGRTQRPNGSPIYGAAKKRIVEEGCASSPLIWPQYLFSFAMQSHGYRWLD